MRCLVFVHITAPSLAAHVETSAPCLATVADLKTFKRSKRVCAKNIISSRGPFAQLKYFCKILFVINTVNVESGVGFKEVAATMVFRWVLFYLINKVVSDYQYMYM